jgi:hypothetical protein
MAKVTEIYCEFGQTVGMDHFSSASCRFGYRISLEDGDDPKVVRQNLINYVKGNVGQQIKQVESQYNNPAWRYR